MKIESRGYGMVQKTFDNRANDLYLLQHIGDSEGTAAQVGGKTKLIGSNNYLGLTHLM